MHDLFTETLWPDHPLGRPVLGTADTIKAATREKVGGSSTTCRGSSSSRRPATSVTRICSGCSASGWTSVGSSAREPRDGASGPTRTARVSSSRPLIKRRKTEQAHICLGTNGLARSDPDRFAFLIVNGALGTGMSSRLFQEIRERGLAYSVYSYHSQYTEAGLFGLRGTTPARARGDRACSAGWTTSRAAGSRRRSSSARRGT